jgi:DNA mismatch repair protein MutL
MNDIRILPEKIASQIAAGEVVERPAAVVRELVDNSIDSGADRIVIKLERGGRKCVKVIDNGCGMSRDDLLLCIERYATSKIADASDLFSVTTRGFRGEALPSIASVSKTTIVSRCAGQISGYRLRVFGGKQISIEEVGAPVGTSVSVRDLFFNIPARRKFLRTVRTETDYIVDLLSRTALALPEVSFQLDEGEKNILNFPGSSETLYRLSALVGRRVAESAQFSRAERDGLIIGMYLGHPEISRSRGDRIFAYVNGRNVRDRLLLKAVIEGYGQRIMKGTYPQAALFVDIDPRQIDINVHPTKQEIRFRDARSIFQTVASEISAALKKRFSGVDFIHEHREEKPDSYQGTPNMFSETHWGVSEPAVFELFADNSGSLQGAHLEAEPSIVGQLRNTYILCETKDGLRMIDQHAAHERILYESLKESYQTNGIAVQKLLVPHEVELSTREGRIASAKVSELARLGLEIDHFGGNTFLLRSVPAILKGVEWDGFLSDLLVTLEKSHIQDENILDGVFTVMACHGAVRAGHTMSRQEMGHLVTQLNDSRLPTNCPHGRPTSRMLTFREIEKWFKRVL